MKRRTLFLKLNGQSVIRLRLLVLAGLFLLGVLLGVSAAGRTAETLPQELADYFDGYFRLAETEPSGELLLSTAFAYYRYPVLAALLGFASIGVILLPLISGLCGFFLSFSVSCLTISFGKNGPLLALSVFGLRGLVTVFCFFLLAVPALGTSATLASLSLGAGRRAAPVTYGRDWWMRIGICAVILTAALCVDLWLSPRLLGRLLEHIL